MRNPDNFNVYTAWRGWVMYSAAALVGFSIAHVAEDFVHGVPERFGFTVAAAALWVGATYAAHAVFIALAAVERLAGYMGNAVIAAGWLVAATVEHLGDLLFVWPYRAGFLSKLYLAGLFLAALALLLTSLAGWRARRRLNAAFGP